MRTLLVLFFSMLAAWPASAYNYAGNYTFAARWNEWGRYYAGGTTIYPEEFGNFNEYDVCPPKQLTYMFPSAVVSGDIKQTCANLWAALLDSNYILSAGANKTRAKDLSEDWIIDYVNPSDSTYNYYFNWYANQYFGATWLWGDPDVLRLVYPIVLSGGPHNGETVVGNSNVLAFGDKLFVMLDSDGSLSYYLYGAGGTLFKNSSAKTFTNGSWHGQTLTSKLQYMIGYEEYQLYFLEGANTLHVFDMDLRWVRTDTVTLGNELSGYSLGDLVDNKIPGYTYIGWDAGPIVIGVTALRPIDHFEVTTTTTSTTAGTPITFTIKACGNAACSSYYTRGVTGTLALSDGSSVSFSIAAGSASTTVGVTVPTSPASGYVAVSITGPSTTPIGSPSIYCGFGVSATSGGSCNYSVPAPLHHVALTTPSSSGLTCTPTTFTLVACATADCATRYTGGLTGNLTLSGTGATVKPAATIAFSMGAGASSTTVDAQVTVVPASGYVTVGTSGLSLTPSGSPTTYCGLGGTASSAGSCNYTVNSAGLLLSVPDHVAEASSTLTITAVQQGTNTASCVPAFANVSRTINLQCAYSNPATGTLPVRVGGSALNAAGSSSAACDTSGASISLAFNASGTATATLQYADAGRMSLTGSYSGAGSDAGLSMSGNTTFTARPASFAFSNIASAPLSAGSSFSAKLTALNNAGQATPNFGKETPTTADYVRLSWTKYRPSGAGASAGVLTGTGTASNPTLGSSRFNLGAVTLSDLKWSEVGLGDLSATLVSGNYLASGSGITGSTGSAGAVGPFVPHHFDVSVTPACGTFNYSGQPFSVTVVARNADGNTTVNYDGTASTSPNQAKTVTLSAATNGTTGNLSNATIAASGFSAGTASSNATPVFTFNNALTAATSVSIRATDSGGVSSSSGGIEPALSVRSGRIKLSNAFGSEKSSLSFPVQAQYWNGKSWVLNQLDSCTTIPAASVALSNYVNAKGQSTSAWTTTPSAISITGGNGTLTLSAPTGGNTGSVDVALNLGQGTTDLSCLANHPTSTPAGKTWLRSLNGSSHACAGLSTYDRDPSARATFGVFAPETKKQVFIQDIY